MRKDTNEQGFWVELPQPDPLDVAHAMRDEEGDPQGSWTGTPGGPDQNETPVQDADDL